MTKQPFYTITAIISILEKMFKVLIADGDLHMFKTTHHDMKNLSEFLEMRNALVF